MAEKKTQDGATFFFRLGVPDPEAGRLATISTGAGGRCLSRAAATRSLHHGFRLLLSA
jgi:hypothetical protein